MYSVITGELKTNLQSILTIIPGQILRYFKNWVAG